MSVELDDVLDEVRAGKVAPLYLLWGEEFLVRKGADELVKLLVPDASSGLNFASLDAGSPREIAQELATLPLFPGRKVVLARDPDFLAPRKPRADGLAKARDAWKAGRRKEGARRLLALVSKAGWGVDQLDPARSGAPATEKWKSELGVELGEVDLAFLREVAEFCREESITAPEGDVEPLLTLFARGLPPGHALVIAVSEMEPKNGLLKFAKEHGRLVEKKVGGKHKDLDVSSLAAEFLAPFKKKLGPGAEVLLKDRVGPNIRLLQSELEKLALHSTGAQISVADVELLVGHVREEEFTELSDPLQKRDLAGALAYVTEQLAQKKHGLMLLGAIASIVRGLADSHDRMMRLSQGSPPRSYSDFQSRVLPRIEAEVKAAKGKMGHPYGIFMGMQAATKFGKKDLLASLVACADADLALKSSGDSQLVIERLLWIVCAKT